MRLMRIGVPMTEHARMTTHLVWRHEGTSSALRALQRWDVIDFAGWAGDGFCGRITKLYFSINLLYASLTVSFASCNTRSRSKCRPLHVALCARHEHCTT